MMHTRSHGSFHGSEWQTKWWFLAYNYSMCQWYRAIHGSCNGRHRYYHGYGRVLNTKVGISRPARTHVVTNHDASQASCLYFPISTMTEPVKCAASIRPNRIVRAYQLSRFPSSRSLWLKPGTRSLLTLFVDMMYRVKSSSVVIIFRFLWSKSLLDRCVRTAS
jgi:hypothetical protein